MTSNGQTQWAAIVVMLKKIPPPVLVLALVVVIANFWFLYQLRASVVGQIIVGGLLLVATLYVVYLLRGVFSAKAPIEAIGSFQIIGKAAAGESSGQAMAHLLRARLGKIRAEMETVTQSLNEVAISRESGKIRSLEPARSKVTIPTEVFEPLRLDFSVGGVEVGGLLAGIQLVMQRRHLLRIVVEYQERQAIVGGNIDLFGGRSLYMIVASDTDEIITKIAYALAQTEMQVRLPKMGELSVDDFRDLMVTLTKVNELNKNAKRSVAESSAYQALLPEITRLVDKLPDWRPLLRLAAELSINAEQQQDALNFYNMELALLQKGDADYAKIKSLTETLVVASRSDSEFAVGKAAIATDVASLLPRLRKTAAVETLYKMLGLRSWADEQAPRIAILGGLPSEDLLPAAQRMIVGVADQTWQARAGEVEYIDSLVQAISLVSANAVFYFTPMTGDTEYYSPEDIATAWRCLVDEAPHVLLVTLGPLVGDPFAQLIDDAKLSGTLVVVSEIPPEWGQQYAEMMAAMLPTVMTVAAVGLNGRPLAQTLGGATAHDPDELFWAPGENIPIVRGDTQRVESRYGHVYAAAIAAGIAGRLSACVPSLSVTQRLKMLRESAQAVAVESDKRASAGEEQAPPVINLPAATTRALAMLEPVGTRFEFETVVDRDIPDNDPVGIESTVEVEPVGKLKRIAILLNISHTYIGDLRVSITTPSGVSVVLHDRTGGSLDNIVLEYTSDDVEALTALVDTPINGTWMLKAVDLSVMDKGRLHRWTLRIDYV